jgi:hypothetical protein
MILTLELKPEIERALKAKAQRRGVPVEKYLSDIAEREALAPEMTPENDTTTQSTLTPRQQAALAGYGKYAGRSRTSEDLIRERREEATMEMQQAAKHRIGGDS